MKKSLLFISFFSLLFLLSLSAQDTQLVTQESVSRLAFVTPGGPGFSTFSTIDRTEGNPYLLEDWQSGSIRYEGQDNFSEELDVLLDLDNNQLFIRLSTGFTGQFPMDRLDEVIVYTEENDTLHYTIMDLNFLFGGADAGKRFYRVLHRGTFVVIHQPIKYLRREDYVENLGMVRRPDKYMDTNKYWVFDGEELIEIRRNARAIQRAFPAWSSEIRRLIRSNDLDMKNDADIAQLFALLEEEIGS